MPTYHCLTQARLFALIQDNAFFVNVVRAWRICTWLEDVHAFVNGGGSVHSTEAVQKLQSQMKLHVMPFVIPEEDTDKWYKDSVEHLLSSPLLSRAGIGS